MIVSEKFIDRYQVLGQLGKGGMATVYLAHDPKFDRKVAIKVLPKELTKDPKFRKRFQREAHTIANLEHPAIVPVYDYGEAEGQPYLVMRYMAGGTLRDYLKEQGPLSIKQATELLSHLAPGLDKAHARGIIHRDLKPANILFDKDGNPYLSDFGIVKLAKEHTTLTGDQSTVGTPAYMSPEQARADKELDRRSDVYSLAVILFEMLTGEQPYKADTPVGMGIAHINDPIPQILEIRGDLPPTLQKIINKGLAKEKQERFSSAAEFIVALKTLAIPVKRGDAETIDSLVIEPGDQERKKDVNRIAYLVGTVSLLLIIVLGFLLFRELSTPTNRTGQISDVSITTTTVAVSATSAQLMASQKTKTPSTHTRSTKTLTFSPTTTLSPSVIAFADEPQGKIVFTCQVYYDNRKDQICVMNADGSDYRRLTNDEAKNRYASFALDGNSIVYTSNKTGNFEIYEMDLQGNDTQLTSEIGESLAAPDISPDGRFITFANSDGEQFSIWVMNRDGSNPHEIYEPSVGDALDPVWSPDGEHILFALGAGENKQLHTINPDGRGFQLVSDSFITRGRSDWSPDGSTIASYSGEAWHREIFLMDTDGKKLRQISSGGNAQAPSFSPDGGWIAFTGYLDNYGDANGCEIYIMRIDGSQITRLTENDYCDWQPRWGP